MKEIKIGEYNSAWKLSTEDARPRTARDPHVGSTMTSFMTYARENFHPQ